MTLAAHNNDSPPLIDYNVSKSYIQCIKVYYKCINFINRRFSFIQLQPSEFGLSQTTKSINKKKIERKRHCATGTNKFRVLCG